MDFLLNASGLCKFDLLNSISEGFDNAPQIYDHRNRWCHDFTYKIYDKNELTIWENRNPGCKHNIFVFFKLHGAESRDIYKIINVSQYVFSLLRIILSTKVDPNTFLDTR